MTTTLATSPYLAAIAHLAPNMTLLASDVSWEEYEQLLDDLGDSHAARIFYNKGQLEIMPPPTKEHERPVSIIDRVIIALSDELGWEIESIRSTRLKRQLHDIGAEPDEAYYIRDIAPALRAGELDLESDPPPHLVIEVDRTSLSLDKFAIYAALGVPEIWRLYQGQVTFYQLTQGSYANIPHSRAFPFLSPGQLAQFLDLGLREGATRAKRACSEWARTQFNQ